jgi:hypothetical protein
MHGPIKVKSLNNTSKWQMGFNSAFKGLRVEKPSSNNQIIHLRVCAGYENARYNDRHCEIQKLFSVQYECFKTYRG